MNRALGIIITGGRKESMKELVAKRSVAAIPVGAKYRAIDFVLSNMINSGVDKVGVVTQYSFRSLMDHLGSGKEWDLDRRNNGLFMFPPYLAGEKSGWYRGSADGMHSNISFLKRSNEPYVIIATGNCIYKMNFDLLLDAHIEKDADITLMYRDMSDLDSVELKEFGMIQLDENGQITHLEEKSLAPRGVLGSTGVYVLKRTLLIELLEEGEAQGHYDFVKDILIRKINELNIMGYEFKGYWRSMSSISMFYNCNMDMIEPQTRKELFDNNGKVYTKVKDETPTKYNEEAVVNHSIIADGCIIEGYVYNSVLSRGVKVGKGAVVRNSIIMQDTVIEPGANLDYVILDKEVIIKEGKYLKGESSYPFIVAKHSVIS